MGQAYYEYKHNYITAQCQHQIAAEAEGQRQMEHEPGNADGDTPKLVVAVEKLVCHHAPAQIEPDCGDSTVGFPSHNVCKGVDPKCVVNTEYNVLGRDI